MTDAILVGARWTLRADQPEGAPATRYTTECLLCPAASGQVDGAVTKIGVWAIQHTAASGHRQYLTTTRNHWRVDPTPVRRAPRADRCPEAAAGAGNRSAGGRVLWPGVAAVAGRVAGPLVVAALLSVAALCGYLLGLNAGLGTS